MGHGRRSGRELSTRAIARVVEALANYTPGQAERDPPFREAAVALILAPNGDDADLLFMRRATHGTDPWSGQIALPGGRIEPQDASLADTAVRETLEETGIDLSSIPLSGVLDELRPRISVLPPIIVRPFVFVIGHRPPLTPSFEVAELFWVPLRALFDPVNTVRAAVAPRGVTIEVEAIVIEGRTIWGMTERILRSFERVVGPLV